MLRALLVVAVGLGACAGNHLSIGQPRDSAVLPPTRDATSDPGPSLGPAETTGDRPAPADSLVIESGSCVPLPIAPLPDPEVAACPATAATPACADGDSGAVVARNQACVDSWGAVPFQCSTWPALPAGQEFLVLQLLNCTDTVDVVSAHACDDHIEVAYTGNGHCAACTGQRSDMRLFALPRDDRPVVATGIIIEPPCLPP